MTESTRLRALAATTEAVRATSSRKAKTELLADLLRQLQPEEIVPAIGFLLAKPRQGAIGVGWATVARLDETLTASDHPPTVVGFDSLLSEVLLTTGSGSVQRRSDMISQFLTRCDESEVELVKRVLIGEARQGALAGVVTDAAAKAAEVKAAAMRRGAMLQGDLAEAAYIAIVEGAEALAAIDLEVQRPIQPMLASTAADVGEALEAAAGAEGGESSVEWKFDGARIQVHLSNNNDGDAGSGGRRLSIYTRNLNLITERLGVVQDVVARLQCDSAVLDGEVLGFFGDDDGDGRPQPFQDTMSTFGTEGSNGEVEGRGLRPYFFDLMYLDGQSLIDRPLSERAEALEALAERSGLADNLIPRVFTSDPEAAQQHLDDALAAGHEGVMVKAADSTYEAGRRGKSWRKVKPVHTLDLVVLGAEWGHGRRHGWLSNLHLGARDAESGEFVMVGKTFKGLTDELLIWQTEQFLARKLGEEHQPGRHTVMIRPELVVEIALDGAQTSTRYPGGVALRFARVKGYRDDKDPSEADTLDEVRKLL